MCDEGYAFPSTLTVASDSHANHYGSFPYSDPNRNLGMRLEDSYFSDVSWGSSIFLNMGS